METVVEKNYRGNGLQKKLLLHQLQLCSAKSFSEATVNPSNKASKRNLTALAKHLNAPVQSCILFSKEDFGCDGHEAEILYRIGPILKILSKALEREKLCLPFF